MGILIVSSSEGYRDNWKKSAKHLEQCPAQNKQPLPAVIAKVKHAYSNNFTSTHVAKKKFLFPLNPFVISYLLI